MWTILYLSRCLSSMSSLAKAGDAARVIQRAGDAARMLATLHATLPPDTAARWSVWRHHAKACRVAAAEAFHGVDGIEGVPGLSGSPFRGEWIRELTWEIVRYLDGIDDQYPGPDAGTPASNDPVPPEGDAGAEAHPTHLRNGDR